MIKLLCALIILLSCETKSVCLPVISDEVEDVEIPPKLIADSFDYPVGKPDGEGYYNAQSFRKNNHLGDDWNGFGGGNSDFGDPVYCIANGRVSYADDNGSGWGNVVRIVHHLPNGEKVESLYAHFDIMLVKQDEWIEKGVQIGTIGDANGVYPAHLHFEIRKDLSLPIGGGYSGNADGFIDPTAYIQTHRIIKEN